MKYASLLLTNRLLMSFPMEIDGRKASSELAANVILLQVAHQGALKDMESALSDSYSKAKAEGYDERERIATLQDKRKAHEENPTSEPLTDEESKALDDAGDFDREAFDAERKELGDKYEAMARKKYDGEMPSFDGFLTPAEFKAFVDHVGFVGKLPVSNPDGTQLKNEDGKPVEVDRAEYLRLVAQLLVKK